MAINRLEVYKAGGSSLRDYTNLSNVAELFASRRKRSTKILVVLSAMEGVTDDLLAISELAKKGEKYKERLDVVEQRHLDVADKLPSFSGTTELREQIGGEFNRIRAVINSAARLRDLKYPLANLQ